MEPQEIIKATADAVNVQLAEAKKDLATKGEVEAVKGQFNSVTEKLGDIEKGLAEVSRKMEAPKEGKVSRKEMLKSIEEVAKKLQAEKQGMFTIKQVADMSRANITGTVQQIEVEPGYTNMPRQRFALRNLFRQTPLPQFKNTHEWVEQRNIEGAAAMTAEGTTKSQVDFELFGTDTSLKKVTARIRVTREMLWDFEGIQNEIEGELMYQLALKEDAQYFSGDGQGNNTNGITKTGYAQPLDIAGLANTYALGKANRWDMIGAMLTQIETNTKGEAQPNAIILSPIDYYLMVHTSRSTDNDYIRPLVVGGNESTFGGIPIYKSITIPAGYVLVGDFNRYMSREGAEGMKLEMGYGTGDFENNFVTILAEHRILGAIKANHVESFVYDSFANMKLFLEKNT